MEGYTNQPQAVYNGQSVRSYKEDSSKFAPLAIFLGGVFTGAVVGSVFNKKTIDEIV